MAFTIGIVIPHSSNQLFLDGKSSMFAAKSSLSFFLAVDDNHLAGVCKG